MQTPDTRLSRRDVLKFFGAMSATMAAGDLGALAQEAKSPAAAAAAAKGYGPDPDLVKFYKPGDAWPLTFTPAQAKTATALADVMLPADDFGPAASTLRVADYIDEWISAPYPQQQKDRPGIVEGLAWLESESQKRFQKDFAALSADQHRAICDDICWTADAKPEFKKAAEFFLNFRALANAAYYGTPDGWKAVGYVGNIPLPSFDGPPPEVLAKLGLEQTVK
jgi:hypothetical protein